MRKTRSSARDSICAGIDARFVRLLNDVGAGVDQRAEHRFIADDAGVVLGMGGRRDFLAQFEQERGAADRFVLAGIFEQLAEQHRIDLPAASCRASMWPKIVAVGGVVEIVRPNEQGDFVARFGQQEQAADDGPLGLDAARRLAIEQLADGLGAGFGARLLFYRGHRFDPSASKQTRRQGEGETRSKRSDVASNLLVSQSPGLLVLLLTPRRRLRARPTP